MRKKILAIVAVSIILIVCILSFLSYNNNISPIQGCINAGTKVYTDYMESKGIKIFDISKYNTSFKYESSLKDFGDFISLVLSNRNTGNKTVYLSWIDIEGEIKIPKFSYLWAVVNGSGSVSKTSWYPTFDVELDGMDSIQEKVNSTSNFYITELGDKGFTVKTYNDSLGEILIEWNTFEDFTFFAGSKTIYLYYINTLRNLRRPIFFYMTYGVKCVYSPYGDGN